MGLKGNEFNVAASIFYVRTDSPEDLSARNLAPLPRSHRSDTSAHKLHGHT